MASLVVPETPYLVQVFLIGLSKYCYTAYVDLKTATVTDLFETVSSRRGISLAALEHYYRFTMHGKAIIPFQDLESQGVKKESTLKIGWRAGIFDTLNCKLCLNDITDISELRTPICRLDDNSYTTHREAFHYECLQKTNRICPLCRGQITIDSLISP